MIYLDYNATAPLHPAAQAAMLSVLGEALNPSSVHAAGRRAKKLLEDARRDSAQAVGAFPNEVVFTASGSEANAMVLRGFAGTRPLLVSAIEHASIAKTGDLLGAARVPVDADGIVDMAALETMLGHLPCAQGQGPLVSVMLANNETGVIQPIADIAGLVRRFGGLMHCDAVQALGKIPVDWGLLKADMLTLSAHKIGGPLGAAALLIRNDLPIPPLIPGGGQELGRRAGTENLAAIVGFAAALRAVAGCPDAPRLKTLRDRFEQACRAAAPDTLVFGAQSPRLPNTSLLAMRGVKSETQVMHFDLAGFAVSAGSACSSGRIEPGHVLRAMGVADADAACALRISLGWATTEAEIDAFAACWKSLRATRGNSMP